MASGMGQRKMTICEANYQNSLGQRKLAAERAAKAHEDKCSRLQCDGHAKTCAECLWRKMPEKEVK
jgi:hypothetical protein